MPYSQECYKSIGISGRTSFLKYQIYTKGNDIQFGIIFEAFQEKFIEFNEIQQTITNSNENELLIKKPNIHLSNSQTNIVHSDSLQNNINNINIININNTNHDNNINNNINSINNTNIINNNAATPLDINSIKKNSENKIIDESNKYLLNSNIKSINNEFNNCESNSSILQKNMNNEEIESSNPININQNNEQRIVNSKEIFELEPNQRFVVPISKCNSHKNILNGTIPISNKFGIYTFVFNNSFSIVTSKSLEINIKLIIL